MPKKLKRVKKRSSKKLSNQKLILVGIVAIFLLLFLVRSPFLTKSDRSQLTKSSVTPVITLAPTEKTVTPSSKKLVTYATATSTPSPTPDGMKIIRGHFVDEDLNPFTHEGLYVRFTSQWTKETKETRDQPNWELRLKIPTDYSIKVPNIPGYTVYVTAKECYEHLGCNNTFEAPQKSTTCIADECKRNPDSWKTYFTYAGFDEVSFSAVLKEKHTMEFYFLYKKN